MNKRQYKGDVEKLRSPERIKMLEIERVVELCLEQLFITKVLDVGCGSGLFAEAFALRNLNVTGIDKNPRMVKTAADMVLNAQFQEGTAEQLPFPDRSFDLVFLGHLLHESDAPLLALKEACRVATSRIAVLEWPYREENTGPPLAHRLSHDTIKKQAKTAGCLIQKKIELEHGVLYRMQPGN